MNRLGIIIPTLEEPNDDWKKTNVTVRTLGAQTYRDFSITVVWDQFQRGASWARNKGFKQISKCAPDLVLFSDDDIAWKPDALDQMIRVLDAHPEASYVYGCYRSNWTDPKEIHIIGQQAFSADLLRKRNYISTMSIIRAKDFPGFDVLLRRHQDWDLWLSMLEKQKTGVLCDRIIFETRLDQNGISFGSIPIQTSRAIIARKHNL